MKIQQTTYTSRIARAVYSILLYVLFPAVVIKLWLRSRKNPGYRSGWAQRFGWDNRQGPYDIWLHAVSVGEAQAASLLARELWDRDPALRILTTTTTPTGRDHLYRLLGEQIDHQYLPYDYPGAVHRFLNSIQPRVAVLMETELWPNLLWGCKRSHIPVILVNARLSEKSAKGYRRIELLSRPLFQALSAVAAQSDKDSLQLRGCGVPVNRIAVTGSLKFDMSATLPSHKLKVLKQAWGPERPVWVAASTHDGEEKLVLEVHQQLLKTYPDTLLLLAPRHPERFGSVAALCKKTGLETLSRSSQQTPDSSTQVYLLDSMGELNALYGLCDVAYVGGSLVPVGGHNLLEPCAAGVPVLFGPHIFNFSEIATRLITAGAGRQVMTAEALRNTLEELLSTPSVAHKMGCNGEQVVTKNRGATAQTAEIILGFLNKPPKTGN